MKRTSTLAVLLGFVAVGPAHAQTPHDVCVTSAFGVPTHPGAPAWADWAPDHREVSTDLDDPRWNRATARAFVTGSATAPLHVRALWSPDSTGQEYLYLSLVSDLDPNATTPRDVFLGFRRAHTSPSVDSGSFGYIFQFHLSPGGPDETAVTPKYCGGYDKAECMDGSATSFGDWWRLFSDPNLTVDPLKKCTTTTGSQIIGHQYIQMNGADALTRPFTWQASPADADFVHYWKLGPSRWAIELRLKIAPSSAGSPPPISAGIEKGSTFWYEMTESATAQYQSIGKYPEPTATKTGVTTSICVSPQHNNDSLFHQELGSLDPSCPGCDPNKFSKLTDLGGDPGDCDTGIKIANIGAVFNNAGPYDGIVPLNTIKAVDASNTARPNTMIAQIVNTNSATEGTITAPIQARFRLANWGSGPIGSSEGQFTDIRGGSAVCLPEGSPPCTAQPILAGQQLAIHFNWTLGNDTTMGLSELCSYGLTPPGGPCLVGDGTNGCPSGTAKSTVTPDPNIPGGVAPCLPVHNPHECMFVELSSTNSSVNFVQASTYNNMNFAEMSTVAREALIDARNLPKPPGLLNQDIVFYVVPRNMPPTVPAGTTTTSLIQSAAVTRALALSRPYLADIARLEKTDPAGLQQIVDTLSKQRPGQTTILAPNERATIGTGDERLLQIASAMRVMPNDDWVRVGQLAALARFSSQSDHPNDELVHDAVSSLGPEEAAQVVPTLEIYPFYKPANDVAYQPMTSFALFLSHEQTLGGVRYEVDGATKVAENVYHVGIPVGKARKIQVRAQALSGTEAVLPPGNPVWPCAGGCAGCGGLNRNCGLVAAVGNTTPGLIAGVFVIRRRRRKKQPAKAA